MNNSDNLNQEQNPELTSENVKLTRREIREAAFLLLYQTQLNDSELSEIIEDDAEGFGLIADEEVSRIAKAAISYIAQADEIVSNYSKTRKIPRIAKICMAVMRLALYEMSVEEIPDKVAINEAIELCKKYASEKDCSFVGGVLSAYYKDKHGN